MIKIKDDSIEIEGSGFSQEQEAITTSSGAADAGKIPALNGSGLIDPTMIGTSESLTMVASETLSAGDFVNFWNLS